MILIDIERAVGAGLPANALPLLRGRGRSHNTGVVSVGADLPANILKEETMTHRYHSHSLRKGRHSELGRIYLLTTATHNRQPILANYRLGAIVAKELQQADKLGLCHTFAWVVMPDHLHWLVELRQGQLSDLMRRVKSRSAIAINRIRVRHSTVWQSSYHDHALRREEDLMSVSRYLVANPLRAGLVETIGDYPLWDAVWLDGFRGQGRSHSTEADPVGVGLPTNNKTSQ